MTSAAVRRLTPGSAEEAAELLRTADGAVRIRGGATKLGWGSPVAAGAELSTAALDAIVAHNEGDLTAVLGAGVPLARAQARFAEAGQMLALDPPLAGAGTPSPARDKNTASRGRGPYRHTETGSRSFRGAGGAGDAGAGDAGAGDAGAGSAGDAGAGADGGAGGATIGGIVATGDSGPLRHRYGAPRDLVLGVRLALPDGSLARAGSQVIKNVAGYDLAKLVSGAFGTLGLLTEVTVRLHPRPAGWCTAVGRGDDPAALAAAASALAHRPLEAEALDLQWEHGAGAVLARFGGPSAGDRAAVALRALREAGLEGACVADDEPLWAMQRDAQRGAVVLRVSTTQDRMGALLATAREHGARVVGRAAHGLAWVTLPAGGDSASGEAAVRSLRRAVAPAPAVLLDAPAALRAAVDPWGETDPARVQLMRRVKERFDPSGRCNPGLFVGGI